VGTKAVAFPFAPIPKKRRGPIELAAFSVYESFLGGGSAFGGGRFLSERRE